MTKRSIVFIINPISGTGSKDVIPSLIERHIDRDIYDVELRFTEYAGHAQKIATQCKDEGQQDRLGYRTMRFGQWIGAPSYVAHECEGCP